MPFDEIDEQTVADLTQSVRQAFERLVTIISSAHGFFRGSHEVALAEAQGATFSSGAFTHIQDLEQTGVALESRLNELEGALAGIARVDSAAASSARSAMSSLIAQARNYRNQIWETREVVAMLARKFPDRLKDIPFERGGLSTTILRNEGALITTQLEEMADELSANGLPTTLLPNAVDKELLQKISRLPINQQAAVSQLTVALGTARMYLTTLASRATTQYTAPLLRSLAQALTAFVAVGARLISVPIMADDYEKFRHSDTI